MDNFVRSKEMDTNEWHCRDGSPWPLGVRWVDKEQAYNFAIYSKHATAVELLLFNETELERPTRTFNLDSKDHKSGPIATARDTMQVRLNLTFEVPCSI